MHSEFLAQDSADSLDITSMLTSASALGALVYFPFANFTSLNTWIIGEVTSQVLWVLQYFKIPAYLKAWNMITLNGYTVEIILACTAIESIALFMGLIGAVRAPLSRLAMAFIASVPVIYVLNLIRDIFVVVAYGGQWFGPDSFVIAHNYIAKAGSGVALFAISYIVLRILPELLGMIDGLRVILSKELRSLLHISGGD
jgi:archaeosortase A (PGF-CTERM-specific)